MNLSILSIVNVSFPDGLAIGMEDIGVDEEVDNQEDENGAMGEEDDANLCYEKHTGKHRDLTVKRWFEWCTSLMYWSNKSIKYTLFALLCDLQNQKGNPSIKQHYLSWPAKVSSSFT